MTGQQVIDLTQATERHRTTRLGVARKPVITTHPFFAAWAKDHRADLRQAFAAPTEELDMDLTALWEGCGFELHDDVVVWWVAMPKPGGLARGFEGEGEMLPWHDDDMTLTLLAQARDWPPIESAEEEPPLSWLEKRRRDRELLKMQRAVIRAVIDAQHDDDRAWGRR